MTELKNCQEAPRKGLENVEKEKGAKYKQKVGQMDVNTTQLESSSIKKVINTIMPQDDSAEGCSGVKGPDQSPDEPVVVLKFLTTALTTARVNRWTSMMTMAKKRR